MTVGASILRGMAAIFLAGAVLNVIGRGTLGSFPKQIAKYITEGYGV